MKNCPDCGVPVGEKHKDGCDVERCPHCGGQALGCVGFDPNDPRPEPWTGCGGWVMLPPLMAGQANQSCLFPSRMFSRKWSMMKFAERHCATS